MRFPENIAFSIEREGPLHFESLAAALSPRSIIPAARADRLIEVAWRALFEFLGPEHFAVSQAFADVPSHFVFRYRSLTPNSFYGTNDVYYGVVTA